MDEFTTLGSVEKFPAGTCRRITANGRHLAIFNLNGEYYAIDATCPHKGGPLDQGFQENGSIFCPLHGWEFDLKTGQCKNNPEKSVTTYQVRISGNELHVLLPMV